jgi:hypothetical protein
MRKCRFTEEQIIAIHAEQERGEHKAFWGAALPFQGTRCADRLDCRRPDHVGVAFIDGNLNLAVSSIRPV